MEAKKQREGILQKSSFWNTGSTERHPWWLSFGLSFLLQEWKVTSCFCLFMKVTVPNVTKVIIYFITRATKLDSLYIIKLEFFFDKNKESIFKETCIRTFSTNEHKRVHTLNVKLIHFVRLIYFWGDQHLASKRLQVSWNIWRYIPVADDVTVILKRKCSMLLVESKVMIICRCSSEGLFSY